jgi:hypothetical protein
MRTIPRNTGFQLGVIVATGAQSGIGNLRPFIPFPAGSNTGLSREKGSAQ